MGGRLLTIAPQVRFAGEVRTLPDDHAPVHATAARSVVSWRDGLVVELTGHATGRGIVLQSTVRGTVPDAIEAIGCRVLDLDADRLLVDGYHSWDWAGLRSLDEPGRGWWGAIAGAVGQERLSIHLNELPRYGALQFGWSGNHDLDIVTTGEPGQTSTRTGQATALGRQVRRAAGACRRRRQAVQLSEDPRALPHQQRGRTSRDGIVTEHPMIPAASH